MNYSELLCFHYAATYLSSCLWCMRDFSLPVCVLQINLEVKKKQKQNPMEVG